MSRTKTEITLNHPTRLLLLTTLAPVLLLLAACQPPAVSQQHFLQFGTLIDIAIVESDKTKTKRLFSDIEELLSTRHAQWHGWLDGDLKRFNEALVSPPGNTVTIPQTLDELIRDSKQYHKLSRGLFNPALGKLVAAWGFHLSSEPDHAMIKQIQSDIPGMHDLVIADNSARTLNPHLQLDFGAIAKGLAVRQIAQLLQRNDVYHFIINAGGDVYAMGNKRNRPWRVAIENPFKSGILASLDLASGHSIFTSGNYRRFFSDDDNSRRHHIIDPRTGEPSKNISAVTVIHRDPVIADVAATTLMLTPLDQISTMAERLGIEAFLVISEDRQLFISKDLLTEIHWHHEQNLTLHEL